MAGEPVSMTQLARALQSARSWNGKVRHVPRPMLNILATLARPVNAGLARKSRAAVTMDTNAWDTSTAETIKWLGRAPLSVSEVIGRIEAS